jgi:hypothetical protein
MSRKSLICLKVRNAASYICMGPSEGIEHNRKVYTKAFASYPDLQVEILDLVALDDIVVVHDRVTGRPDGRTADEITPYEVRDGRITRIEYVKQLVR